MKIKKLNKAIMLDRKQISNLYKITEHFNEVEYFEIHLDNSSGIGPVVKVSFDLFNKNDTTVDITNLDNW